jgi:hypothetical protein
MKRAPSFVSKMASFLLAVLFAHLALMASPLHADHAVSPSGMASADFETGHPQGHASGRSTDGDNSAAHEAGHGVNEPCDDARHELGTLIASVHVSAVQDCPIDPAPAPKPARGEWAAGTYLPSREFFASEHTVGRGAQLLAPRGVLPGLARVLLQIFRN